MIYKKLLPAILLICVISAYPKEIIHNYTVSVSPDLKTLYVKADFADIDFYYLYAGSKSSARYTKNMHFLSDSRQYFFPKTEELPLRLNAARQTLYYEFDIASALGNRRWSAARQVGDDVIVPPDLWLWRPYALQENEHINVKFDLPAAINYTVPWIPVAKNVYRIPRGPLDWPSAAAFGTFNSDTVRIGNCILSLAFMDGNYVTTQKELKEWLRGAAKSVCNIYAEFPVKNIQLLIIPGKPGDEPVPFGMVVRGGGISIYFYIDPSRPLKEFIEDWTATHEMSHCLLPMINRDDAWLSEGLATYYQYILMGRDGRLTGQQTWQRIYNGFQKGIRGSKGKSLKETAQQMHELRAFRNVYWSGAAILLKADVALRKESRGTKSLDSVLKQIQTNYLDKQESQPALGLLQAMDSLADTHVFMNIYNACINSEDFPVDDSYWAKLGVSIKDSQVCLDDDAPLAQIRKNILENVN